MKLPGEFFWGAEQTFRGVFTLGVGGPAHHIFPQTPPGVTAALIETVMDDIKNGQRINCNGVHCTVIGKRNSQSALCLGQNGKRLYS